MLAGLLALILKIRSIPVVGWVFDKVALYFARYFMDHVRAYFARNKKKNEQAALDKENQTNYEPVKTGELSDEEEIRRTEDALSGRKPRH